MARPKWFDKAKPYAKPDTANALFYIFTSIVPYLALLAFMFLLLHLDFPYWTVLILSVLAAGFYVRLFMILHDCSHSSFVRSRTVGAILGHVCGVLTFTPFFDWQRKHGIHHGTVANLDKRGTGDVWTMTLQEYGSASLMRRAAYRFFRNPLFLFIIAPVFLFVVGYRFPHKKCRKKDCVSIAVTDAMIVLIVIAAHFTVGIRNYTAVQLPIAFMATSAGVWLFFIQHQFKEVYWARNAEWDVVSASLKGASFYDLPAPLRWFTGNIGYHNLHHINPRIPCYHLKKCYDGLMEIHGKSRLTLGTGFRSLRLHLWDEDSRELISFREGCCKLESQVQS